MTRRTFESAPSPADVKLDLMTRAELCALLATVPGATVTVLTRMDIVSLTRAARTYIRIGRMTEAQVLQFKTEGKA